MSESRSCRAAALILLLVALQGCASDKPCRVQDLTVSAPVASSFLYPSCHGRNASVIARVVTHGSVVEALRVVVTARDGTPTSEPPSVRVRSGAAVQAITTDGNAAVIWFTCPGPCDGAAIAMTVSVPQSSPCPYRIRLVPVLRAR
jgi:hypothetical protein